MLSNFLCWERSLIFENTSYLRVPLLYQVNVITLLSNCKSDIFAVKKHAKTAPKSVPTDRVGISSMGLETLSRWRDGKGVSNLNNLAQSRNCHLLTKNWLLRGSSVTCRIHTDPLTLFSSSIHRPFFQSSSPVHYVFHSIIVEQDRMCLQNPGFDRG